MPSVVRLSKSGLNDLINNIKGSGNDATELENLMFEINDDEKNHRPVKRRETSLRIEVEELTTEERLETEVGELFEGGITGKVLTEVIEMDMKYSLAELKKMAVEAGLSPSGHKKELAARLIAKGIK